jgi:hypothetical protein
MNYVTLWEDVPAGRTPLQIEDELVERATVAYQRWCRRNGYIEQQPSRALSFAWGSRLINVIELRNSDGCLATYRWGKSGRLVRIGQRYGKYRRQDGTIGHD